MIFELLVDAEEAVEYANKTPNLTDAQKAHLIGFLSDEGLRNSEIREALDIDRPYTVSHLKRAARLSENELTLWHNNPTKITLGHVRAIANFPEARRTKMLRDLLARRIPVHEYESIARGEASEIDVDIKRFQESVSEQTGHPISIRYNSRKRSGSISIQFFSLGELEDIAEQLGYKRDEFE
ncbi:MAG TPA: transcriptional regulator [Marinobacter sp.]|uniref:ParB C-terminal dimerisation domain-containing protein n=1 Tax=marine sediment metagenome TaxID=412755 RepID=A0A0F9KNA5_9ZZZZ|nr:transcriptional regulator [Marinobacter sp.]